METKTTSNFWWLKSTSRPETVEDNDNNPNLTVPKLDLDVSSSLVEFLEREQNVLNSNNEEQTDVDVGSILDEINRVAAQSPLGPFRPHTSERSIEDIMRETERIYMESSKSFEQLSQRSKTSQNVSSLRSSGESNNSTPTPKSISPLPLDRDKGHSEPSSDSEYSDDFSVTASSSSPVAGRGDGKDSSHGSLNSVFISPPKLQEAVEKEEQSPKDNGNGEEVLEEQEKAKMEIVKSSEIAAPDAGVNNEIMKALETDNEALREEIRDIKTELHRTIQLLEETRRRPLKSPEINLELERVLENFKDSQEINTALQLQLDGLNKTHQHLKNSFEDLLRSNSGLERRVGELDATLTKYKVELLNVQQTKDQLVANEISLNKLLELEKGQNKSLKTQNEKDARCIQDLNRQIKEMERIIARKHPDSVSALIVAAKGDATDTNLTARRVLEDRIKALEQEAISRDTQSSKVFLDIQEKFQQLKAKYESHISDLELHVSDLKGQLKRKLDTYDVYTQTFNRENVPAKDSVTISTQTEQFASRIPKNVKKVDVKGETHLLATIRGLQSDLTNKERVMSRLQKEIDELRKTNRRLQKEREGSLKNLSDKREFRSYPEKLALQLKCKEPMDEMRGFEEELRIVKSERDKMKQQLMRLEDDYQALKTKRLHDLNALQEAHEHEMGKYVTNVAPLREQLEMQKVTITTLQSQLCGVKEELAIVSVERDHLNNRVLKSEGNGTRNVVNGGGSDVEALLRKISFLEKRYEEREHRLRAIVHGLAQKSSTNKSCEQCADRQQQLIGYKVELDQLLATLRALK